MEPTLTLPAGVVFDCDGTLVDTEPLSNDSWNEVLGRRGYAPTREDVAAVIGRPYTHTYAYYTARVEGLGTPDELRAEVREVFLARFERDLVAFDDAVGTVRELHDAGVPVAVASSSSRRHVERVLEFCGLSTIVTAALGAEDTTDHKPHPAPYLHAARRLGVDPSGCAAVEDSRVGITSAKDAGMFTVAVRRGHVPDADLAHADRIVDELTLPGLIP